MPITHWLYSCRSFMGRRGDPVWRGTARRAPIRCRALAGGLLVTVLCACPALAAAASGDTETDGVWIDRAHDAIVLQLDRTADWFDRFFGDPRIMTSRTARANLNLVLDGFYSGVEDESRLRVRARGGADLPRFNERLRLVLSSDADAALTGRDLVEGEQERSTRMEDTGGVGLRLQVTDRPRHDFALGGGLAGGLSPEIVLNARYRYTQPLGPASLARLTPTVYWGSDRGPGVSAVADWEWIPDPLTLWRYTLFADYREDDARLDWSTQFGWHRRLDERSAINPRLGLNGEIEPRRVVNETWASLRYRRQVLRSWLFVEIEPGLSWHERVDYRTEPTIALRLEVQFFRER